METKKIIIVRVPNSTTIEIVNYNSSDIINKLSKHIEFINENLLQFNNIMYDPTGEIVIRFLDAIDCFRFLYTMTANYDILLKGDI